jgi:phosphoribosylanthranilate isomerase
MFVKICGITSAAAVDAAVLAGADAVGFVFAPSPREVAAERAAALCESLPRSIARVAVMRHPTPALWRHVWEVFAPDWLQSDAQDFATLDLPAACFALPVYRNGRVLPGSGNRPARVLFEGAVSGSGLTADWDEARDFARATQLILAGGLDQDNVADAIRYVRPWGVDVSSGVEKRPGEKDPAKIKEFVARVRAVEES